METETFHWINMDSRSAVALYEAFALSTRALPFSESAGKPSGWSSLRKGWGCKCEGMP